MESWIMVIADCNYDFLHTYVDMYVPIYCMYMEKGEHLNVES
jgi:hypothetical protein